MKKNHEITKKITIIIISIFSFFSNICFADTNQSQIISTYSKKIIRNYNIPGVSIVVFYKKKSYYYNYGYTSADKKNLVTNNTLFAIASIGKLFTSLLLSLSDERNTLKIDDNIAALLPPFLKSNQALKKITYLNLATHTSGLEPELPKDIKSKQQFLEFLANWRNKKSLYNHWQYSNTGYALLGYLLEKSTNNTYSTLLKTNIIAPLKMEDTFINVPNKIKNNLAQGYTRAGTHISEPKAYLYAPAWGIFSSTKDMEKFLKLTLKDDPTPISLRNAMSLTQKPYQKTFFGYQGLGWDIHNITSPNHIQLLDKSGSAYGYRSYIAIIPKYQLGIVILLNRALPKKEITLTGQSILFSILRNN